MISVRAEVDIAVSPERVWRVLMDFAHYRNWHPYVEMEGTPALGAEVDFYFRNKPQAPRGWKIEARVTQLEPASNFAYRFGIAGLCMVEQWYALERIPDGTRVTHGSDFRGMMPMITGSLIRKRLLLLHKVPVERLAQGFVLSTAASSSKPTKRPPKPRKGFRGYRGP